MELVQSVRRSIVAERYNNVLVQRLHNYLAGIFTLTEHVRAIMTRQPEALVARWAEQRKSRFGTSEVSFVGDLRRYIQHYAHLPIRQRWSFSGPAAQTQHSEFFVELDVHELREWHDWLAPSRHFLEGKESIELLPLVERHARVVVAGNRWLLQQLVALVVPLQDEYNELVVKANATLTGLDLEKARLLTEERTRQRFSLEEPRTT